MKTEVFAVMVLALSAFASAASCTLVMTGGAAYGPLTSQVRAVFIALPEDVTSATIRCSAEDAGASVAVSRVTGNVYASRICSYPVVPNATTFVAEAEAGDAKCSASVSLKAVQPSIDVLKSFLEAELTAQFNQTATFSKTAEYPSYISYLSNTLAESGITYVGGNPTHLGYYFMFYKILTPEDVDVEKERYIVGQVVGNESVEIIEGSGSNGAYIQKVRYQCVADGAKHNIVAYLRQGASDANIAAVMGRVYSACDGAQAFFAPAPMPTAAPSAEPSPSASATPRPTVKPTAAATQVPTPTPLPIPQPAQPQDKSVFYAAAFLFALAAALLYLVTKKKKK